MILKVTYKKITLNPLATRLFTVLAYSFIFPLQIRKKHIHIHWSINIITLKHVTNIVQYSFILEIISCYLLNITPTTFQITGKLGLEIPTHYFGNHLNYYQDFIESSTSKVWGLRLRVIVEIDLQIPVLRSYAFQIKPFTEFARAAHIFLNLPPSLKL